MILGDYHTHTNNSDGKGTLEDTLIAADKIGLLEVGISDHGLRHIARGMKFGDIASMRRQIEQLQGKYKCKALLSVEANIYSSDGDIDLKEWQRDLFDYILAGYHKAAFPRDIPDMFRYNIPAFFAGLVKPTDNMRRKYTRTIVKAVQSKRFNVLTHLNYGIPSFVADVAKACVDNDVLLELNGKRVSMTDEEVMIAYQEGVTFIVNSDAHSASRIGDVSVPMAVVERLGIDKTRIANWNNTVDMKVRHD